MSRNAARFATCLLIVCCVVCPITFAQQAAPGASSAVVPMLINYSGVLNGSNGKSLTGTVGVTFSLYKEQEGGSPLWVETQNVQLDKTGHYSVQLGAASSHGLPPELFAGGEARWLGVQAQGENEQPRTLLMSVPYALKALDAETIGGKPASSFMLAPTSNNKSVASGTNPDGTITGHGTANFLPKFSGPTTINSSKVYQTPSGDIGIGTTSPVATLDVSGTSDIRDTLTLFPKLAHPALKLNGTAFQVSKTGTVTFVSGQTFPGTGTVTSVGSGAGLTGGPITHSGTLSIKSGGVTNSMLQNSSLTVTANSPLTGGGSVSLGGSTSLGLKTCSSNQILEFTGGAWTCVAIPVGTITGVTAGTDLTGGGSSGNVTLNVDTSKVPQLAAANSFTNINAVSVNSSSTALTVTNSGTGDAIDISENASGAGVFVNGGVIGGEFENSFIPVLAVSPTSGIEAVFAEAEDDASTLAGIVGVQAGSTTETIGVEGVTDSPAGFGIYGESVSGNSTIGTAFPSGVWGDSSSQDGTYGTSDSAAALGAVSSDSNNLGIATVFMDNINSSSSGLIMYAEAIDVGGLCTISNGGVLSCNGAFEHVASVDGGSRKVALNSIETPESWFEDAGSGQLSHGEAIVNLEGTFGQTVNTGVEYHVFLTPNGDCKGLYVAQKSPTSFVVRELGGGTSNVAFDYRIMAKRRGFESARMEDRTKTFHLTESPYGQGPAWKRSTGKMPSAKELLEKHKALAQKRTVAQLSTALKH